MYTYISVNVHVYKCEICNCPRSSAYCASAIRVGVYEVYSYAHIYVDMYLDATYATVLLVLHIPPVRFLYKYITYMRIYIYV